MIKKVKVEIVEARAVARSLLHEYQNAQYRLQEAKNILCEARSKLRDHLIQKYGRGVHVLFAMEDLCAWVYKSVTERTWHNGHETEGKTEDKLRIRKMIKIEHDFIHDKYAK